MQTITKNFFTYRAKRNNMFDNLDWLNFGVDDQLLLLENTVNHHLCATFPPRKQQQILFLKKIIHELEDRNKDICDELYEKYTQLLSLPPDECDVSFQTYFIDDHNWITLKESINYISQGTTGLCTWQAAFYLTEWALENKQIFKNKNILELGSGVGLTGLVLNKCCSPNRFIFSDFHHEVLQLLKENIMINICNESKHYTPDDFQREPLSTKNDQIVIIQNCMHCFNKNMPIVSDKTKIEENSEISEFSDSLDALQIHRHKEPDDVFQESDLVKTKCDKCGKSSGNFYMSQNPQHTPYNSDSHINDIEVSSIDSFINLCKSETPPNIGLLKLDWEDVENSKLYELGNNLDVIIASDVVYDVNIIPSLVNVLKCLVSSKNGCVAYVASTVRNEDTKNAFLKYLETVDLQFRKLEDLPSSVFLYDRTDTVLLLEIRLKF